MSRSFWVGVVVGGVVGYAMAGGFGERLRPSTVEALPAEVRRALVVVERAPELARMLAATGRARWGEALLEARAAAQRCEAELRAELEVAKRQGRVKETG
ncbi:MAG: hypothetical protein HYY04_17845 [Chloroflexi bacterium]|nr:hypothetical protein [Chloroflexota bacterium]